MIDKDRILYAIKRLSIAEDHCRSYSDARFDTSWHKSFGYAREVLEDVLKEDRSSLVDYISKENQRLQARIIELEKLVRE